MSDQLRGKKIAFLVANEGVEQVELTSPLAAVREAGAEVELLAPEADEIQAFNHLDKGETYPPDRTVADADPSEYDGLVLPGGVANPDQLRTDTDAVQFVRSFFEAGKPVGVICHGPWTLINADVVDGRTLTSWPSLQTDLSKRSTRRSSRSSPRACTTGSERRARRALSPPRSRVFGWLDERSRPCPLAE
jgi:protease I